MRQIKLLEKNPSESKTMTMKIEWNHFAFGAFGSVAMSTSTFHPAKIKIDFHLFFCSFSADKQRPSGNFPFRVFSNKMEGIMNIMECQRNKSPEHNESLGLPVHRFPIIFITNGFQFGPNYWINTWLASVLHHFACRHWKRTSFRGSVVSSCAVVGWYVRITF